MCLCSLIQKKDVCLVLGIVHVARIPEKKKEKNPHAGLEQGGTHTECKTILSAHGLDPGGRIAHVVLSED